MANITLQSHFAIFTACEGDHTAIAKVFQHVTDDVFVLKASN